jgi:hypothetical protein
MVIIQDDTDISTIIEITDLANINVIKNIMDIAVLKGTVITAIMDYTDTEDYERDRRNLHSCGRARDRDGPRKQRASTESDVLPGKPTWGVEDQPASIQVSTYVGKQGHHRYQRNHERQPSRSSWV